MARAHISCVGVATEQRCRAGAVHGSSHGSFQAAHGLCCTDSTTIYYRRDERGR